MTSQIVTSLMKRLFPGIVIAITLLTATFAAAGTLVVSALPTPVTVVNAGTKQQFFATNSGVQTVVFWTVSGTSCSGFGCGSIGINNGVYTAPAVVNSPFVVTITATSSRDWSTTGSLAITVDPALSQGSGTTVSITPPGPLQLGAGASQPFSATVVGPINTAVTWSVGGGTCGGGCGTITQAGVYTAPSFLSQSVSAVVTATSQATPSASASVTVQLVPVVTVAISPFSPQMLPGTSQLFSASVTGSSIQSVKWSVYGTTCAGFSCGTISSSGFYTAPSVVSPLNVTVQATANADSSKFATAAIVVGPIVTISVTPPGLSLTVNTQQQFSASVTGASSTAVNWSVSGPNCSGAATCGMISPLTSSTALYQAPAGVPSPSPNVNITATLASDFTKSGSTIATIVLPNSSRLNGQFAFSFKGFDPAGAYYAVGSFTADGNGNLTNGLEDINCGIGATDPICAAGPVAALAFTGSYTINADGRGTFTINPIAGPSQTFTLAMSSSNAKARFIESDTTSGIRGSGVLEIQTPSAFANSALSGPFAFKLAGVDSAGNPIAAIGNMTLFITSPIQTPPSTPVITAGVMDVNDNGNVSCYPPESGTFPCISNDVPFQRFSGTYNIAANGRGTANFSIQGFVGNTSGTNVFNFSYYVVSSGEFFLLSMDPGMTMNPVVSGQALQQIVQPSVAFQPGPAVFSWSGWSPVPPLSAPGTLGVPQAAAGQVSLFDNTGDVTMSNIIGFQFDVNSGGAMSWGNRLGVCSTTNKKGKIIPSNLCAYALQPNHDILVSAGQFPNMTQFRVFPTTTNAGFLLGWPAVIVGTIEPQAVTVPAPFMFGSDVMTAPNSTLISGVGSLGQFGLRTSPIFGNEDESLNATTFLSSLPFTGYYANPNLPNGHAFMYLDSTGTPTLDFWVVNINKTVAINDGPGTVPSVIIFEH